MSQPESSQEQDFEKESARLNEALKTCRAVVENYRTMMHADAFGREADTYPDAENDNKG